MALFGGRTVECWVVVLVDVGERKRELRSRMVGRCYLAVQCGSVTSFGEHFGILEQRPAQVP